LIPGNLGVLEQWAWRRKVCICQGAYYFLKKGDDGRWESKSLNITFCTVFRMLFGSAKRGRRILELL